MSPAPKRAVTHSHIAVRGEHYGAGPSTAARTHGHRSARRAPRCLPSNLRCGGGNQQTARNPHGSRQSAAHGGSSAGYHADGAEPAGRGSRRTHGHRSARRAPRCRPSNPRCGGGDQQTARNPHGSRQSAEHGRSSAGYHADGAEPSGRGSRLSTAEAVRGIVQRHVQERQWRDQPTHPRGTYHREATDLRSAARDSSQNDRDDRRDTLSRSLSRRVLAKCPGHEMQPRIGRTQLPSMSL